MCDRLQAIATPLVVNMDKVQIIPPPKDVDPRVLTWKGAAVLGKMDSVTDLWVTQADWVCVSLASLPSCSPGFLFFVLFFYFLFFDDRLLRQDLLGMRGLKERCFYL